MKYPMAGDLQRATSTDLTGNPPRVLREKWGDASEIVIESNRFGYTGWLESKRGGGRLPISFGAQAPTNTREAMELAKKFLRNVHGKINPANNPVRRRETEHPIAGMGKSVVGVDPHGDAYIFDATSGISIQGPTAYEWAQKFGLDSRRPQGCRNPEETHDTDILDGMTSAIWVTSWASWVEEMSKEEREERGDVPVSLSGVNWEKEAPPSPASALEAAEDLYLAVERANGSKTLGELFEKACQVDGCRWNAKNAELFGHYVAMQAMGHGVSWFDDHKQFPLKMPAKGFEAHTADGEEVEWSPKKISTQNGGRR